ncbi:hypothetical protein DRQ25_00765, partial [Candidatus Fermentibacteria bacterium]
LHEEKGEYTTIAGELSPWQRLLKHIQENNLTITSLSLCTKEGRRFHLPSAGNNPRFKAFVEAEKPASYKMFRQIGVDIMNGKAGSQELYTVIEAFYNENFGLQIWVCEKTGHSWSLIL